MHPILTLVFSLLVSLGPELPLGNTTPRPAAFNQTLPSVASNGRDFVVLWSDMRSMPPVSGSRPALYAARVGGPDHLIVDSAFGGDVFWNGSAYEALYMRADGHSFLQRLDDDGAPVGPATEIDLLSPPREAATNGRNLLTLEYPGAISLNALSGATIWRQVIEPPVASSPIAGLPNGDYRFVALTNPNILLVTVDGTTGMISSNRILARSDRMGAYVLPNGNALVAWTEGDSAKYMLVDKTQPATFATGVSGATMAVGWDGHQFGIAIATENRLRLTRVAADGRLLDTTPLELGGGGPSENMRIANSATEVLIAGDGLNTANADWDVVTRTSHSFDDIAAAQPRSIATSLEVQQRPRVADGGLMLWTERDVVAQLPGAGAPHTIASGQAPVGIGRGTSSYLAAWIENGNVVGKRVAFDSTPIDAAPIVLADAHALYLGNGDARPAVAFDGTNFLVVWPIDYDLLAVRVAQDGHAIDAQPIPLTSFGPRAAYETAIRAVWSGSRFVVAWDDQLYSQSLISPRPAAPARVAIVTLSSAGVVLDAQPRLVFDKVGLINGLGLAANGEDLALTWSEDCVYELPLHNDGSPAGTTRTLACGTVSDADAAWDGSEYVTVWTQDSVVKAQRLDVDDAPFDVSPAGAYASQPSIGASRGGATIAYVRFDTGIPRVFARMLQRSGTPPRHRASR